jgi:hypothetical protein
MFQESRAPFGGEITVEQAKKLLSINDFPGQRKLNPLKVKSYIDNMDSGMHRRVDIAVAKVRGDPDRDYLMNGQHNCEAIVRRGKEYKGLITYYLCSDMMEAWELFTTFDIHGTRTESQFLRGLRGISEHEKLQEIPMSILSSCATALYSLRDGNGTPYFSSGKLFDKRIKGLELLEHINDVLFVSSFRDADHLRNIGTTTAIITTKRKDEKQAQNFWRAVADGELLERRDPEMRLREALIKKSYVHSMGMGQTNRIEAEYSLCIGWWNARRSGKEKTCVKVGSMKDLPKVL